VPSAVVTVETLTRSSSGTGIERSVVGLDVEVSEASGVSLSEVRAQYLEGIGEEKVDQIMDEERDHLWED
jgi:hypothetical protein